MTRYDDGIPERTAPTVPIPTVHVIPPKVYPKRKPSPDRVHRPGTALIDLDELCELVAGYYNLPACNLRGPRRWRSFVKPRQVFMYLCRRVTTKSHEEIGEYLNRDHATVIHGERQVEFDIESDHEAARRVEILTERVFALALKGAA